MLDDDSLRVRGEMPLCENRNLHTQAKFRLLVVRLGAMGDILHALPAVTALRRAHPDWEIGWVIDPRWKALLSARGLQPSAQRDSTQPLVDRLHFAPTKAWGKQPLAGSTLRSITELRRELRGGRYDAVVDFQGALRSAILARMAGTRRIVGELHPREGPARWFFHEHVATRGAHVIEQDIEIASAIASDALQAEAPLLPLSTEAEVWCDSLLQGSQGMQLALMNPGAGWGAKRWPAERYGEVAQRLIERGMRVLVNAGPGEEALAEAVRRATQGAAQPVSATLDQLIALTRRIAVCIAGDTGPLHLACALGRPVVGIYGPTDPSRNGPYGTRFAVLRSSMSKRDHSRRMEPEAGLLTITPQDVLRATEGLLAEESN